MRESADFECMEQAGPQIGPAWKSYVVKEKNMCYNRKQAGRQRRPEPEIDA